MSRSEKKPYYKNGAYVKQPYETRLAGSTERDSGDWNKDIRNEPECTLYLSMLKSAAWMNLTGGAAKLYPYLKMQAYSNGKNRNTRPTDLDYCKGTEFCFNKALIRKAYPGLYPSMTQFYRDIRCLIENGFIKVVVEGKFTFKSVYDLSDDWQKVQRKTKNMDTANRVRKEKQDQKKTETPTRYDTTQQTDGCIKNDTTPSIKNDTTKRGKTRKKV